MVPRLLTPPRSPPHLSFLALVKMLGFSGFCQWRISFPVLVSQWCVSAPQGQGLWWPWGWVWAGLATCTCWPALGLAQLLAVCLLGGEQLGLQEVLPGFGRGPEREQVWARLWTVPGASGRLAGGGDAGAEGHGPGEGRSRVEGVRAEESAPLAPPDSPAPPPAPVSSQWPALFCTQAPFPGLRVASYTGCLLAFGPPVFAPVVTDGLPLLHEDIRHPTWSCALALATSADARLPNQAPCLGSGWG